MNPLTQQGINALKLGDRTAARQLLAAAIKQDPRDVTAWLWLAGALDKEEEQIDCLRYVLKVDPQNQAATRGLAQLLEHRSAQAAPVIVKEPAPAAQPIRPKPAPETPPARPVEPEPAPLSPPAEPPPIMAEEAAPEANREAASEVTPEAPSGQQAIESIRESFQVFDEPLDTSGLLSSEPTREELLDALAEEEEIDLPAPAFAAADTGERSAQVAEAEPTILDNITSAARLPFRRRAARAAEAESARLIFRARPSLVPALASFWLFLFGTLAVGSLLKDEETLGLLLTVGVGILLEFVVLYAVIRGLAERYELTSQALTVRFRGKRARIPIADIYNAVCTQSFIQRLLGTGNIEINASVGGQLSHLRLRNIPQCRQRTDQIMYLVNDHDAT